MDTKTQMLEVLKDMNVSVTDDVALNPSTVTGIFMEEHGIDARFLLDNICLLQTLNENKAILAKATALI